MVRAFQPRGSSRHNAGQVEVIGPETFEITKIAPGEIVVDLMLGTVRFREVLLARRTVQLHSGLNQVRLPLPVLCRVELVAGDLAPGAHVSARHQDLHDRYTSQGAVTVDEEHRAVFEHLPPGPYLLRADGREMSAVIGGDTTLVWQPEVEDVLRVTISRPEGYLASVGLQSGDLIVGVGGQRLATAEEIQAALFRIAGEEAEASLLVRRGGATLTVTVDALRFTTRENLGGHWTATTGREP
jgi:hypothetical protein